MQDILNFFLSSPMNIAMVGAGGLAIAVVSFYLLKTKKKKSSKADVGTVSSIGYAPVAQREATQLDQTMASLDVSLLIRPKNNQYLEGDSDESSMDIVFDKPSVHEAVKVKPQEDKYKNIANYNIPALTDIVSPLAVKPPVFVEQYEINDSEWNLSQFEEVIVTPVETTVTPVMISVVETSSDEISILDAYELNLEENSVSETELILPSLPLVTPVIISAGETSSDEINLLDSYELNLEENSVSETELILTSLPLTDPISENNTLEKTDYNDYILEALNFDSQNDKKSALITMKEACEHIKGVKILFYFKMAIQSYEKVTTDNKLPEIIDHFYYMERQKRRQEGEVIANHPHVFKKQDEPQIVPMVEKLITTDIDTTVSTKVIKNDDYFDGFPPISDLKDIGKYQL